LAPSCVGGIGPRKQFRRGWLGKWRLPARQVLNEGFGWRVPGVGLSPSKPRADDGESTGSLLPRGGLVLRCRNGPELLQ
jgi:hypothetical protein